MNEPLDELYFKWLYGQVASVKTRSPNRTFWELFRQMFTKEYVWFVPNDDNRVEDGRDLRLEFFAQEDIHNVNYEWMTLGCSMLEMLIGVAKRLAFEADGRVDDWFWHLIHNLGLTEFNDAHLVDPKAYRYVNNIMDRVVWRTYSRNGRGGLFPLDRPVQDQRDVEIWYQLSAYLLELD